MSDYEKIRQECELNSMISERVVDDFLLHFAVRHQGLEKKMNTQLAGTGMYCRSWIKAPWKCLKASMSFTVCSGRTDSSVNSWSILG